MSKLIVNEIEKYDAGQLTITTGTNVSIGSDLTVGGALNATLSTAAQTNITSVGTLSSLAVSGDLTVDTSTLKVDSSTNRVGIGTTSPASDLHISTAFPEIRLQDNAYPATNHYSTIDGNGGSGVLTLSADDGNLASNSAVVFKVDASERMRIDSSGNVFIGGQTNNLIGTGTTDGSDTKSIAIVAGTTPSSGRGGYAAFYGNEHATDAGNTYIIAGNSSNAKVEIHAVNSGGHIINKIGGEEIARFTPNGLTFNGDTAAANALDDYEEGTWTPAWSFATSGSVSLTVQSATYTKIGRQVTVNARLYTNSISSPSGNATITGLPFAVGASIYASGFVGEAYRFATDMPNIKIASYSNESIINVFKSTSNSSTQESLQGSDFNSGAIQNIFNITAIYFTA